MSKRRPAEQQALAYLEEHFPAYGPPARLPSVQKLAYAGGVSYATMWRAAAAFRAQREPHAPLSEPEPATAGERLAKTLETDILRGSFAGTPELPSTKELERSYRVSYRTVRTALQLLASRGLLSPYKRSYRIASTPDTESQTSVVLLARRGGAARVVQVVRSWEYLHAIESECSRRGIGLHIETLSYRGTQLTQAGTVARRVKRILNRRPVMGFMIWTSGLKRERVVEMVQALAPLRLPVAIIDEFEEGLGPLSKVGELVKVFRVAVSRLPGLAVGRYLLGLGHRRVAYISHRREIPWSQSRCRGLREAFSQAGLPNGVEIFDRRMPLRPGMAYPESSLSPSGVDSFLTQTGIVHSGDSDFVGDRANAMAREELHRVGRHAWVARSLEPLFEKALSRRDLTAWVCCNDEAGLAALAYLHRRPVKLPRDLSLIGFDDTHSAALHGLSSYSFNSDAVIHAGLGHILSPRQGPWANRPSPVEIEGYVNARMSSAEPQER